MAKPEWGTKRQCLKCSTKFYDLKRAPILCPACGAEYDPEANLSRLKRGRAALVAVKEAPAKAKDKDKGEEDEDILDDITDDDLIKLDGDEDLIAADDDTLDDDDLDVEVEKEERES